MKTGDLLKTSKFNYSGEDKEGNLLLCNFAKGPGSFSKILKCDVDKYKEIMINENIVFEKDKGYFDELCSNGFLIPEDADEDLTIKSSFYNTIMDNRLSLIIMPTEQCNFRCKYCYESFEKGKMTMENQKSLLKYIQNRLANSSGLNISWFGGEPLEALDVIEYIMKNVKRMCDNRKIIYTSHMTTNAYGLDAETFDKLYKFKIYEYQITLDGLKEQHDIQRVKIDGSGTHDKIIENLVHIKNSPQYKLAQITVRINVTIDILERLDEFLNYYKSIFGGDERFNIRFFPVGDLGGERVQEMKEKLTDKSYIYEKLEKYGIYDDNSINLADTLRFFYPMNTMCYAERKNSLVIGSDLSIYKCTVHFDRNENKIGHINQNGDAFIDENMHNRWYIKETQRADCKSCFFSPCCCGKGCPVKTNFGDSKEHKCNFIDLKKNLKNYMLYLSSKMEFKTIKII